MGEVKDGGWGWAVTFASFVVHMVVGGVAYSCGIYYLILLETFNKSPFLTSWVGSILMGMSAIGGLGSSVLVQKIGYRMTVVLGGALAGSGLALSVLCNQLWHHYLSLGLLTGLGLGVAMTPSVMVLNTYFYEKRTIAASIAISGTSLGIAFVPVAVHHLESHLAWRGMALILAGFCLVICSAGMVMRNQDKPESSRDKSWRHRQRSMKKIFMVSLLKSAAFQGLIWSNFIWCTGISVYFTFLPDFSIASGNTREGAAVLIGIMGVSSLLSRGTFQLFSHSAKLDPISNLLCTAGLATIVTGLFNEFFKHKAGEIGFAILLGMHMGYWSTFVAAVAEDLVGANFLAYGRGFLSISVGLGLVAGPPLAGLAYEYKENHEIGLYFAGGCLLLSSVLLMAVSVRRCYFRPPETWSDSESASTVSGDNVDNCLQIGTQEDDTLVTPNPTEDC